MPSRDPLQKATISFRQHGVAVTLEVLEGVFAGAGVDAGTRHLLRWLVGERYAGARTVLDLGCGYGPLALWLAAARPDREVLAVDRDARALEATVAGVAANGLDGRVEVAGSLGFDGIGDGRFDLVVSNVPAKVGPAALRHLVLDACHHVIDGGLVALVVVNRLATSLAQLLADPAVDLLDMRPTRAYTAFEYRFRGEPAGSSAEPGFERGLYLRGRHGFQAGRLRWEAGVSYSIPEFDTLGHGTVAAVDLLPAEPDAPVAVAGVGQGHLALAFRANGFGGAIRLIDRDLLALRTAAANLDDVAADAVVHAGRLRRGDLDGAGTIVVALDEREPVAATASVLGAALDGTPASTPVIVHGRSADVHRVLELLPRYGTRLVEQARARHGAHMAIRSSTP